MYPELLTFCDGVQVMHVTDFDSALYIDNKRVKKYHGETAWSDAERDASDKAFERMYH